jgi:hypothetical protein
MLLRAASTGTTNLAKEAGPFGLSAHKEIRGGFPLSHLRFLL